MTTFHALRVFLPMTHAFWRYAMHRARSKVYGCNLSRYALRNTMEVFMDDFFVFGDSSPLAFNLDKMPTKMSRSGTCLEIHGVMPSDFAIGAVLGPRVVLLGQELLTFLIACHYDPPGETTVHLQSLNRSLIQDSIGPWIYKDALTLSPDNENMSQCQAKFLQRDEVAMKNIYPSFAKFSLTCGV
ncbi:hypothetical protein Tco_1215052 [Tanacetum coccineum]